MPYVPATGQTPPGSPELKRVPFPSTYPISPGSSDSGSLPPSGPPSPTSPTGPVGRGRANKKSSLKHGKPYHTPSPASRSSPMRRTKSVPDEMPKLVHFPSSDRDLKSVRTFKLAARPVTISLPGSEDEESSESEAEEGPLLAPDTTTFKIDTTRSLLPPPTKREEQVFLDALEFSTDAVMRGRVRVQNVSFHKRVVVRFSLDNWTSTSEVNATYFSSSPCGQWDTFTFSIRLEDTPLRNRTMSLCVHYIAGDAGDWWDNNGGDNYRCVFTPARLENAAPKTSWEPTRFPRGRSATVSHTPTGPPTPASVPHVRHKPVNSSGGWHDWTQNVSFKPKAVDTGARTGRALFVI